MPVQTTCTNKSYDHLSFIIINCTSRIFQFDSPDFSFDSFRDAEERLIQLGAKKIVHVQTGQVGVTYDDGVLKILNNGTHEVSRRSVDVCCLFTYKLLTSYLPRSIAVHISFTVS